MRVIRMCVRFCIASLLLTISLPIAAGQQELEFAGTIDLPEIARFADLPRRMYLEPELLLPDDILYLDDGRMELFLRLLETAPDNEILVDAIRSIERVATEKLSDASAAGRLLQKQLKSSDSRRVRQASASALAAIGDAQFAGDVAKLCVPQYETLCLRIEPDFVAWGGDALRTTWLSRVQKPDNFSTVLVRLASEGLVALNDASAVEPLLNVLASTTEYAKRHAAARAVSTLDEPRATREATTYAQGDIPDRLLACALLEQSQTDAALTLLSTLCDDPANAVASQAWSSLLARDPHRLLEKLDRGLVHSDANVRTVVTKLVQTLPTIERCDAVHSLLADVHIGVRNAARTTLQDLATSQSELRPGILKNAGAVIGDASSGWQQVEQSLILLGELRHREWQADCVPWLDHVRPEVYVTAAWLLHLMPEQSVAEAVNEVTLRRYKMGRPPGSSLPPEYNHLQLVFLFQHAGLLRTKSLQPLCEEQFSKNAGDPEARAAGLWALGKINEGKPDPTFIGKLLERIFDDNPFQPEFFIVRRMAVLSIAWMDGRTAVSDLQRARATYGEHSMLGETVRWALPVLGAEQPPSLEPNHAPAGGFPVGPL
ncbi:MAG: HEAT repeat domain-containing protein [Planctomycetaceae bacterium]